ncbi:MAG: hypothetical protein K6A68_04330 [Clostridiales bacterium]|nr:hypothetical protein [Clostridiales bacterium]
MKKILAMVLALAMMCTACSALAEGTDTLPFKTLGEAIDAAGETAVTGGDEDHWAVAMEKDGKYIRLIANEDDTSRELQAAIVEADDFEAAFEKLSEYIRTMPIVSVEEFTVAPLDPAEIEGCVGKTILELEDAGFEQSESGVLGDGTVQFILANGVYAYAFVVDTDEAGYEDRMETGEYGDLVVKSASFYGLSENAAFLNYHADGTVEEMPDPFVEYTAMMDAIRNAAEAVANGTQTESEAIESLKEQFAEEADVMEILYTMYSMAGEDALDFVNPDGDEYEEDFGFYSDEAPEVKPFISTWVAENGEWRIEVYDEDGGMRLMVVHRLGDNKEDIWEYAANLSPDKTELTAVPFGLHYRQDTVTGEWDEEYYEDGDAIFSFSTDGKLLWKDVKEDAGKGLEFEKIGNFYGGRWMKDDIEVEFYDWYDGEYDIRMFKRGENDEILADAIVKGPYDAAADTITATGYFDPDQEFTVTFSYDDFNNVVWTENGESTTMEYSLMID